ncbi:MAG: hypothetical protein FWH27_03700 [Planctomycetaceae bacterium]|nr:hypothetical protein [Planctomycetaceae bacterium]
MKKHGGAYPDIPLLFGCGSTGEIARSLCRVQNISNQSRESYQAVEAEQSSKSRVKSEDKEAEHSAFCILNSAFAKMTETDV